MRLEGRCTLMRHAEKGIAAGAERAARSKKADDRQKRWEEAMQNGKHWVGSWAAAPAPAEGVVGFNNHTLRMMPRLSLGGDTLRVRISNAYGARPLVIGAARIGVCDTSSPRGPGI